LERRSATDDVDDEDDDLAVSRDLLDDTRRPDDVTDDDVSDDDVDSDVAGRLLATSSLATT